MLSFIQSIDFDVLLFIREHLQNPILDAFLPFYTNLGGRGKIWIVAGLILICTKKYRRCGIYVLFSMLLGTILANGILKPWVGRLRPCSIRTDIKLLIALPRGFSFPSGHSTAAFSCATAIYLSNKKLGRIFYVFAALMAFSRLYLFVHFPTDVICGSFLGFISALLCVTLIRRIKPEKLGPV